MQVEQLKVKLTFQDDVAIFKQNFTKNLNKPRNHTKKFNELLLKLLHKLTAAR